MTYSLCELCDDGVIPVATGTFYGSDKIVNTEVANYVFGATGIAIFTEHEALFKKAVPYWRVEITDRHKNEEKPYHIVLEKGHGGEWNRLDYVADYCDFRSDLCQAPAHVDREEREGDGIHQALGQFVVSIWLPLRCTPTQCRTFAWELARVYWKAVSVAFPNYAVLVYRAEFKFYDE